jgi:hypothetical protein
MLSKKASASEAPASSTKTTASRAASVFAMLLGAAIAAASIPQMASANSHTPPPGALASPWPQVSREPAAPSRAIVQILSKTLAPAIPLRAILVAQDDNDDSGDITPNKGASPDEIEKYVAVYRAMQRDHTMTIEQATAAHGLSVPAFRDLEQRIESDDLSRDDARRALAAPAENATPDAASKLRH